jgi:hypothetical protein
MAMFTSKSTNKMYTTLGPAIFEEPGDPMRFSYSVDAPLAPQAAPPARVQDRRRTSLPAPPERPSDTTRPGSTGALDRVRLLAWTVNRRRVGVSYEVRKCAKEVRRKHE